MKIRNAFKFVLLFQLLFVGLGAECQTVGYSYMPLAANGCNVKFSVAKQDTSYCIIVIVESDRFKFLSKPTMMLKTFDGDVLKLQGTLLDNGVEPEGVISGIVISGVTTTAQFAVTQEQFELLNKGVSKIRLSTIPVEHERTFAKDKIGKELYSLYIKAKSKEDNF
jgi:hypothetical protein